MVKKKAKSLEDFHRDKHSNYKVLREGAFYLLKVYNIIKKLAKENKIKKAIDIGCSDGSFALKLKEDFGFDMYGLDIAEGSIKLCKKKGIKGVLHNLTKKIPFKDNFFDLVILCEVIEHIFDTDFLLREINRILNKKGYLVITTHNINSLSNRIRVLIGRYPAHCEYKMKNGHIRVYNFDVLIKQLKENNFEIVKVTSPNFPFPIKNRKIHPTIKNSIIKAGDLFPRLSNQVVILAKKR